MKYENNVNKKAMLAVADVIEWADKKFDLTKYGYDPNPDDSFYGEDISDPNDLWAKCGTVGCVWGWTCAWADLQLEDEDGAADELGLDEVQAGHLFFWNRGSVWDGLADEFGWERDEEYGGLAEATQVTAKQAAEVLRRIAKGKVKL